jgi:predicted transcriptional regulator
MLAPQINGLGLMIMETLWTHGPSSIRAIHDALPEEEQPKINTTRATFYRLQHNGYVRRVKQLHHAQVFEAAVSRESVYNAAIDSFADLFHENMGAVITRLVETGRLDVRDLDALERALHPRPHDGRVDRLSGDRPAGAGRR